MLTLLHLDTRALRDLASWLETEAAPRLRRPVLSTQPCPREHFLAPAESSARLGRIADLHRDRLRDLDRRVSALAASVSTLVTALELTDRYLDDRLTDVPEGGRGRTNH